MIEATRRGTEGGSPEPPQARDTPIAVLGVRHHGVGSAAATLAALERLAPAEVLIEGPPEAQRLLDWAAHPDMRPPVALMATWRPALDGSPAARFFPFAEYAPEWVALRWAAQWNRPVRFTDLALGWRLALVADGHDETPRPDPFETYLGPGDAWESQIERGLLDVSDPDWFGIVSEAVAAARALDQWPPSYLDRLREARMRIDVRKARRRAKGEAIAIVCGAWHAPALDVTAHDAAREADDRALLAAALGPLQKRAVAMAWVPWTDWRLSRAAGYAAGPPTPGWSRHLWRHRSSSPQRLIGAWCSRLAATLREAGGRASLSEAIDAARLAEALAALRDRSRPDLPELRDAHRAVFGGGSAEGRVERLVEVERRLEIGEAVGSLPSEAPRSQLMRSVEVEARRLRLAFDGPPRRIVVDRRAESGRARALFLRRLAALGAPYGERLESDAGRGAARETWSIEWAPEIGLALAFHAPLGSTLAAAADAALRQSILATQDAGPLAGLITTAAEAELATAQALGLARLPLARLRAEHVVDLLGALNQAGDGRVATAPELLRRILHALPAACRLARGDAALELRGELAHGAGLFAGSLETDWCDALARIAKDPRAAPELQGWSAGQLLAEAAAEDDVAPQVDQSTRIGMDFLTRSGCDDLASAAAWLCGFFAAGAPSESFSDVVDAWLSRLDEAAFRRALPLFRRAAASLTDADRRVLMSRLDTPSSVQRPDWDLAAVAAATPLLDVILGGRHGERPGEHRGASEIGSVAPHPARRRLAPNRRWRLALGRGPEDQASTPLASEDARMDAALAALYDAGAWPRARSTTLRRSARRVALWLDELRAAFPVETAAFVQQDAVARLGLRRLLLAPDVLSKLAPDLSLAADLAALSREADPEIKAEARRVVHRAVTQAAAEIGRNIRPVLRSPAFGGAALANPGPRAQSGRGGSPRRWRRTRGPAPASRQTAKTASP